jgi:hypothetical protein
MNPRHAAPRSPWACARARDRRPFGLASRPPLPVWRASGRTSRSRGHTRERPWGVHGPTRFRLVGPDRPPPSAVRTPRCGAAAHTARTARRARLRRPRDRGPRVSSTSGGSPRNVPIGTRFLPGRRQQRPPRGTTTGHPQAAPAVARDGIPATPKASGRPRSCSQRGAQRHDDRGGRSSAVSGWARRAVRNERDRSGGNASVPPVTIGEQAIGYLDRPHGRERKLTAWTSSVTKRREAAHEAVRRSSSGRRSGYVMPTEGGMTRGSERTRPGRYQRPPTTTARALRRRLGARARVPCRCAIAWLRSPDLLWACSPQHVWPAVSRRPWTDHRTPAFSYGRRRLALRIPSKAPGPTVPLGAAQARRNPRVCSDDAVAVARPSRRGCGTPTDAENGGASRATTPSARANDTSGGGNDTGPGALCASRLVIDDRAGARRASQNQGAAALPLRPSRPYPAAVEQLAEPQEPRGAFCPADSERDRLALTDDDERAGGSRHRSAEEVGGEHGRVRAMHGHNDQGPRTQARDAQRSCTSGRATRHARRSRDMVGSFLVRSFFAARGRYARSIGRSAPELGGGP